MQKRNIIFDLLKTISILGVIYIHSSFLFPDFKLPIATFRFGVPVFIMISFCLIEINFNKTNTLTTTNLLKRFKRLLIPFLFWSVLYFILNKGYSKNYFDEAFSNLCGLAWTGQYFFIVLLQLTCFYYFIVKYNCSTSIVILNFIFTSILYFYYTYISLTPIGELHILFYFWMFYVILPIYLVRSGLLNRTSKPSLLLIGILISILLLVTEEYLLKKMSIIAEPYSRISVLISSVLLFICFCWMPEKVFKKIPVIILNQSDFISKNSLAIFCINPLLILLFNKYMPAQNIIMNTFFSSYLFCFVIAYLCILISKTFSLIKLDTLVK